MKIVVFVWQVYSMEWITMILLFMERVIQGVTVWAYGGLIKPWPKGVSGNPSWRPRKDKWVALVLKQLKDEGIETIKSYEVREAYESLLNCDFKTLKALARDDEDNTAPALIRVTAWKLLNPRDWWYAIEAMLDRSQWKAIQKIENEYTGSIWLQMLRAETTEELMKRLSSPGLNQENTVEADVTESDSLQTVNT